MRPWYPVAGQEGRRPGSLAAETTALDRDYRITLGACGVRVWGCSSP